MSKEDLIAIVIITFMAGFLSGVCFLATMEYKG